MKRMVAVMAGFAFALLGEAVAIAQNPPPAVVTAVVACRSLPEAERFACYERAAAALDLAIASNSIVVLDQESVRRTRRTLFGFDLPDLPFFGGKDDREDRAPREIVATVKSVRAAGFEWLIELDTGAVWQTSESLRNLSPPREGAEVRIMKATAGGYMIQIRSRRVRIRRVR
jgi:hypothetical protein